MYAGTLGGPVIKNVYSQKMVRVVERLAAGTTNYPRTSSPERFKAHLYGRRLDLLIFDGGRHFHRVAMVVGERLRGTLGRFVIFARSGDVVHYWS